MQHPLHLGRLSGSLNGRVTSNGIRQRSISYIRLLRDVVAMVGPKPGKGRVRAMLIDQTDFPDGNWRVYRNNTARVGSRFFGSDASRRARKAGSISAYRCFADAAARRQTWIQIIPYATEQDAEQAVPTLLERLILSNTSKELRITEDWKIVPEVEVIEMSHIAAWEVCFEGLQGAGSERLLAGNVANVVVVTDSLDSKSNGTWGDVAYVAARQASRVRRALLSDDSG